MESLLDYFFAQFRDSKKFRELFNDAALINKCHAVFSWDEKKFYLTSNWYGQGFFSLGNWIRSIGGIKLKPIQSEDDDFVTIPENEIFSEICSAAKTNVRERHLTECLLYNFIMQRFEVFDSEKERTIMHVDIHKVTLFSKKGIITTYPIISTQPHTAFIKVETTVDTTFMIEFDTMCLRHPDCAKLVKCKIKAAKDNNLEKISSLCEEYDDRVDIKTYGTKSVVYCFTGN